MLRHAAVIALGVILCCIVLPSSSRAQGSDTLWTDTFSNQAEHPWTIETGTWRVFFTEFRGQLTTRRAPFIYEAGVQTPAAAGPTPMLDWQSVVRMLGRPGPQGHRPQILAVRHNVTALKEGFGVELGISTTGRDQIRIVRYGPNYGAIIPYLAEVDTTLDENAWYTVRFSVLHTPFGVELKAKVWRDAEPEAWNLEVLSPIVISGPDFGIGALGTFNDPFIAIDYVIILGDKAAVENTTWGRIKNTFK